MTVIRLIASEIHDFVSAVVNEFPPPFSMVNVESVSKAWIGFVTANIGMVYGVKQKGHPAAFMLSLFVPDLIDGNLMALEYLWMASPKRRSGGTAVALLKALELEAVERGCKKIVCGSNQVFKPAEMRRFYLRMGYAPFSESFSKEIK